MPTQIIHPFVVTEGAVAAIVADHKQSPAKESSDIPPYELSKYSPIEEVRPATLCGATARLKASGALPAVDTYLTLTRFLTSVPDNP